ncbi:triose-phosphate transporter family-domain-containing protein [Melanogaster broomeanus]|nr:triose-phosphate transporter family-domain-containing protein [Melanogaster broomeanus]
MAHHSPTDVPLQSFEHEHRLSDGSYAGHDGDNDGDGDVHIASAAEKKRLWWRNALINSCFILSWFLFSTVLSVYNKWMFSPDHFAFPFPLLVTTLHMLVQFLLAASLRLIFPRHFRPDQRPPLRNYSMKAAPAAITTGLDIGLSNVSLKTLTLSFYTMCKSSSLIFVLIFAFLFRLETFSLRLVVVMFIIFAGVVLMVASETAFILSGFLLVMGASVCSGLRWSFTHLVIKDKAMGCDSPPVTIFWLSPAMAITLAVTSTIWEGWGTVLSTPFFANAASTAKTVLILFAPGVLAFCVVLSEYYIIRRAGVLPMSITGIAKEVSTITISAWFFGDELTPVNITGVSITICGIALFTYHKYRCTVNSNVALDAHGNPIQVDDHNYTRVQGSARDFDVELDATTRTAMLQRHSPENGDGDLHRHLLFSSEGMEEGEEDAEEIRSMRSSKMNWGDESSIAGKDNT